jgi:hypothetical protein
MLKDVEDEQRKDATHTDQDKGARKNGTRVTRIREKERLKIMKKYSRTSINYV